MENSLRRIPGIKQRVETNVLFTHARHDLRLRGFKLNSAKLDAMAREFKFDDQTRDEKLGGEVAFRVLPIRRPGVRIDWDISG